MQRSRLSGSIPTATVAAAAAAAAAAGVSGFAD